MVDRLINWGDDATDARYQTRDSDPTGGDFVVVNDTTGGGQLLIWDYSAGEWVYGGPVNMSGNDITNAGAISATSLGADETDITNLSIELEKTTDQSITSGQNERIDWDSQDVDSDLYSYDESSDTVTLLSGGDFSIDGQLRINGLSAGDIMFFRLRLNGSDYRDIKRPATGGEEYIQLPIIAKDLSSQDELTVDVQTQSDATLFGNTRSTFLTISKLG